MAVKGKVEIVTTRVLFNGQIWRVTGITSELNRMKNKNPRIIVTIYNHHKKVAENVSLGEITILPPFAIGERQCSPGAKQF